MNETNEEIRKKVTMTLNGLAVKHFSSLLPFFQTIVEYLITSIKLSIPSHQSSNDSEKQSLIYSSCEFLLAIAESSLPQLPSLFSPFLPLLFFYFLFFYSYYSIFFFKFKIII